MKCKTCGFDVKEPLTHCPMCGTRVVTDTKAAAASEELSWNTMDFPKPKEMTDINMAWPEFNKKTSTSAISEEEISAALAKNRPVTLMSEDASEGFVSVPEKPAPEKNTQKQPYWYTQKFTATGVMQTGPAWPMAPGSTQSNYPAKATIESMTLSDPIPIMPNGGLKVSDTVKPEFTLSELIKEAREEPEDTDRDSGSKFYSFRRKNDEFQKLLDREYDRIHAIHGDDYDPLRGTVHPIGADQPVQAQELSAFEKLLLDEEAQNKEETPAQKFFSQDPELPKPEEITADDLKDPELPEVEIPTGDPSQYNIEKIENTIKELESQELIAESNRAERKKRLAAMAAAREAYFQSLDSIAQGKHPDKFAREAYRRAEAEAQRRQAEAAKRAEEEAARKAEEAARALDSLAGTEPEAEGSVEEPTREIPVGGILEAINAKPARTAALTAAAASVIRTGHFKSYTKRISEDAEARAKLYEGTEDLHIDSSFDQLLNGLPSRRPVAGVKDAEKLATKYDLGDELKDLDNVQDAAEPELEEPVAAEPEIVEFVAEDSAVEEPTIQAPAVEEAAAAPEGGEGWAEPTALQDAVEEPVAEVIEETVEPVAEAIEEAAEPVEEAIEEAAEPVEESVEEAAEEIVEPAVKTEPTQSFEPVSDDTSSLAFLYEENGEGEAAPQTGAVSGEEEPAEAEGDEDEEESGSRHIGIKVIIAILIICALFELAVLGMSRFMPDAAATQSIVSIEEAIREAIVSAAEAIANFFKGLFGGN